MKTLKLIFLGMALLFVSGVNAQLSISLHVGTPPLWGPAGYSEVHYYYLPDVESYYDVRSSMFIYYDGGTWVHRSHLPRRYRDYDLYGGYKVVMNNDYDNKPYTHFKEHKEQYARGYRGHEEQRSIGERPGKRNPGGNRHQENRRDKGRGDRNSHDNGNGKNK